MSATRQLKTVPDKDEVIISLAGGYGDFTGSRAPATRFERNRPRAPPPPRGSFGKTVRPACATIEQQRSPVEKP